MTLRHPLLSLGGALLFLACGGDGGRPAHQDEGHDAGTEDASVPGPLSGLDARPKNPTCVAAEKPPKTLADTGCFQADGSPVDALIPYEVRVPLWSDGADKQRWLALPDGATFEVERDGDLTLPPGGVLVKSFLHEGRLLETRFLVRKPSGAYDAYSYAFPTPDSEGELALEGAEVPLDEDRTWSVPSSEDCAECHTEMAGSALGTELAQLNMDHTYPSTGRTANQVKTLAALGMFDGPLSADLGEKQLPLMDGKDSLELRAKAYLHANCAICHRPGGNGFGESDMRFDTPLGFMTLCDARPEHDDGGLDEARLITPGAPEKSLLALRMRSHDPLFRMPPVGSVVVDEAGTKLVERWIRELTECPPVE